jgi:hypothetical protein
MRDHQVIMPACRPPISCIRSVRRYPSGIRASAPHQRLQHRRTRVQCVQSECRIGTQKPRGETAVAVSQHQRAPAASEPAEPRAAAPLQARSEGSQFHPAVERGKPVEVWAIARLDRIRARFRMRFRDGVDRSLKGDFIHTIRRSPVPILPIRRRFIAGLGRVG